MIPGLPSREAALRILLAQESEGAFLKDLFPAHTDALPKPDRALVRAICLGVLRNLSLLDFNIRAFASKPPGGALRSILRLSAYQILFLDVAPHAAVNLGAELAKRHAGKHQAGFANAVLKKIAAAGLQRAPGASLRSLAINHSHPEWLVRRWHKRLGDDGLKAALERDNEEAPLYLRVNPARATVAEVGAGLLALGVASAPEPEAPLFLRLEGGGEAALHSDLFANGAFAFQDPAAGLIARLAAWGPPESLLDLCSAPGGKAACLLEYAQEHARENASAESGAEARADRRHALIVCNDLSFRRLRRIRDARERLGHAELRPVVMDPAREALRGRFDCVIVDAPCSNLGVIRRRPEARWRHAPEDFPRLAALQKSLLADAARLASPGGRILYATCSPEDEEAIEVVEAFLAGHPGWRLADAKEFLPGFAVKRGCLWLHPGETGYDGFFAARLERAGDERAVAAGNA
jgi:16S rRNA (cytosine967-C5)-methyltransferase